MSNLTIIVSNSKPLIDKNLKELKGNVEEIYYRKNFKEFMNEIQRKSNIDLFGIKNFIVLKNLEYLAPENIDTLINYFKTSFTDFILIYNEEPLGLFEKLKKEGINFRKVILSIPTKSKELFNFIKSIIKNYKLNLPDNFIWILINNYHENIDELFQELDKLSFYPNLSLEEIIQLLNLKTNLFIIQESILKKDITTLARYLFKYFQEIKYVEEVNNFIQFLSKSLQIILFLKLNQKPPFDVNQYYLYKLQKLSTNISVEYLKFLFNLLSKIDLDLKKFRLKVSEIPQIIISSIAEFNNNLKRG